MESCLIDYDMIYFSWSIIALSCAYIVSKFFNIKEYKILYSINDNKNYIIQENMIKESARQLCFLVKNLNHTNLVSIKKKYSLEKFGNIARYCQNY